MLILVLSTSLLCALPPLSFVLVLAFAVGFSCITTLPLYLAAKFGEKRELKEVEGINTQIKCLDSLNDEGKSLFSSNSDSYSYYDTTDAESNVRRVVQLTKQNAPQSKTELRDRFFKQEDASTSLSDQVQTAFNSLPPHKEPRGYYIILNRQFPVKMLGGVTD